MFEGLEEVELGLTRHWDLATMDKILQTISSNCIRKVTFYTRGPFIHTVLNSEIDLPGWSRLDETFLKMANTFDETGKKLEVTFKALVLRIPQKINPVEPGQLLERCQAKAIIRFEYIRISPSVGTICGLAIHYDPDNWSPTVNLFVKSDSFRALECIIVPLVIFCFVMALSRYTTIFHFVTISDELFHHSLLPFCVHFFNLSIIIYRMVH